MTESSEWQCTTLPSRRKPSREGKTVDGILIDEEKHAHRRQTLTRNTELVNERIKNQTRSMIQKFHTEDDRKERYGLERVILKKAAMAADLAQNAPTSGMSLLQMMAGRRIPAIAHQQIALNCPAGVRGFDLVQRKIFKEVQQKKKAEGKGVAQTSLPTISRKQDVGRSAPETPVYVADRGEWVDPKAARLAHAKGIETKSKPDSGNSGPSDDDAADNDDNDGLPPKQRQDNETFDEFDFDDEGLTEEEKAVMRHLIQHDKAQEEKKRRHSESIDLDGEDGTSNAPLDEFGRHVRRQPDDVDDEEEVQCLQPFSETGLVSLNPIDPHIAAHDGNRRAATAMSAPNPDLHINAQGQAGRNTAPADSFEATASFYQPTPKGRAHSSMGDHPSRQVNSRGDWAASTMGSSHRPPLHQPSRGSQGFNETQTSWKSTSMQRDQLLRQLTLTVEKQEKRKVLPVIELSDATLEHLKATGQLPPDANSRYVNVVRRGRTESGSTPEYSALSDIERSRVEFNFTQTNPEYCWLVGPSANATGNSTSLVHSGGEGTIGDASTTFNGSRFFSGTLGQDDDLEETRPQQSNSWDDLNNGSTFYTQPSWLSSGTIDEYDDDGYAEREAAKAKAATRSELKERRQRLLEETRARAEEVKRRLQEARDHPPPQVGGLPGLRLPLEAQKKVERTQHLLSLITGPSRSSRRARLQTLIDEEEAKHKRRQHNASVEATHSPNSGKSPSPTRSKGRGSPHKKKWHRTEFDPVEAGRRKRREQLLHSPIPASEHLSALAVPRKPPQPETKTAYSEYQEEKARTKKEEEAIKQAARQIHLPVFTHTKLLV